MPVQFRRAMERKVVLFARKKQGDECVTINTPEKCLLNRKRLALKVNEETQSPIDILINISSLNVVFLLCFNQWLHACG